MIPDSPTHPTVDRPGPSTENESPGVTDPLDSPGPFGTPGAEVPLGRSAPRVLLVVFAAAALADLAVHTRAGGLAGCLMILVLCAGLVRHGRVVRRGGRVLLCGAAALSSLLVVRVSPWMVLTNLAAIAAVMLLACSAERSGRFGDTRFSTTARRVTSTGSAMAAAIAPLARTVAAAAPSGPSSGGTARALAKGVLIAAPVVAVIGISLASADAVFASVFDRDLRAEQWVGHLAVLVVAAWIGTGWFVQATRPPVTHPPRSVALGAVEATTVMVALTVTYAVFAWTQFAVARRGPEFVAATTGLTYAEYARSGFFQLLWVAGATALVLLVLRSTVVPTSGLAGRCMSASGTVAAALTLVVVHAAIRRLDLYEAAFGSTMLRFASSAVSWWLGAVFVVIGAWFAAGALGVRSTRDWLPTALAVTTLAAVVLLNMAGPESTVMRHNLDRAAEGAEFDLDYALRLSDDAVPTLVDGLDGLPAGQAERLQSRLCADHEGPERWTLPEMAAGRAVRELCS